MTFPENKTDDIAAYADAYFTTIAKAAASVDRATLARGVDLLVAAYEAGRRVYVCGNGGSAAISNHLVCDHVKGARVDTDLKPRVISLVGNMETITAVANDQSYDDIFVYQLQSLAEAGDVLVTISSSGDSENVVRACDWAVANGIGTIALTGFQGGRTAALADVNIHVDADNYGVVEDVHQSLMHVLAQFIRMSRMDAATVSDRRF